MVWNVTSSGIN